MHRNSTSVVFTLSINRYSSYAWDTVSKCSPGRPELRMQTRLVLNPQSTPPKCKDQRYVPLCLDSPVLFPVLVFGVFEIHKNTHRHKFCTFTVPNTSSLMWPPPNSFFRVALVAAYNIFWRTYTIVKVLHVSSITIIKKSNDKLKPSST